MCIHVQLNYVSSHACENRHFLNYTHMKYILLRKFKFSYIYS